MPTLSISLQEWIAFSTNYEAASSEAGRIRKEAQLAYVERAIKVALLLLDDLNHAGNNFEQSELNEAASGSIDPDHTQNAQAGEISVNNFVVNITLENDILANSTPLASLIAREGPADKMLDPSSNLDRVQLGFIMDGIISVDFSRSMVHKSIKKEHMKSEEGLRNIGLILYRLFCRGKVPSENAGSENEALNAKDALSNRDDDIQSIEQPGSEKGRRRQSVGGTRKLMREMHISDTDEQLLLSEVPASIHRLVIDLIQPGDDVGCNFDSIEDIIAELQQMVDNPDLFLYNTDASTCCELDFGNSLFGRVEESTILIHAAARVPLAMNISTSNLVLIGGHSGSGKSCLMKNVGGVIMEAGWISLNCKFDRLKQGRHLSCISSAFDTFFASLVALEEDENFRNTVVSTIEEVLPASAIVLLCGLMPSLGRLFPGLLKRVVSDTDLSCLGNEECADSDSVNSEDNDDESRCDEAISNVETSKNRLHYLFRRLLCAISTPQRPLLFFLDDLQWAEIASLDLLRSLLMDVDHLHQFDDELGGASLDVLFIGAYRSNEVDDSPVFLNLVGDCNSSDAVVVTNIHLDGMPSADICGMISETLRQPSRFTRALAGVIETKTLGNPLFVKTFLTSLVDENILQYSLVEKRWVWDIEEVKSASIDESVAELLTRKLLRLPINVQGALKLLSCIGSHVKEMTVLKFITKSAVRADFISCLKCAIGEGILEWQCGVYRFAHDMLQQAAYDLMSEEERSEQHYSLGMHLLFNTSGALNELHLDPDVFIAIDQINTAKSLGVTEGLDLSLQICFASSNLKAGEKLMELSDFASGLSYIEYGISFLPETQWESHYDLTLRLYESACFASYATSVLEKTQAFIICILENASSHSDKLKAKFVLIKVLGGAGKVAEAIEKSFSLLDELGESFPPEISPAMVHAELASTRTLLGNFSLDEVISGPRMSDTTKRWTLKLFDVLIPFLFNTKPSYIPLVSCRMIKVSAKHGYCSESAIGLIGYSHALMTYSQDIDESYRWGKIALLLLERLDGTELYPRTKLLFYSVIGFWIEPLQSSSSALFETYKGAMMAGDVNTAMMSAQYYTRAQLMCGENLSVLQKQSETIVSHMGKVKQIYFRFLQSSHRSVLLALAGNKTNPFGILGDDFNNEDAILHHMISTGKSGGAQGIYFNKLLRAFWFKRYEEAAEMAEKYGGRLAMRFTDIYRVFYEGLIAFHFIRCSPQDHKWFDIGKDAVSKFRVWVKHSKWNFENKLLLLEAELHYSNSENEDAKNKYEESINSAQKHHFVHEEGLAMELLGNFHKKNGNVVKASENFAHARDCFKKWGAFAVVENLDANIHDGPE